MYQIPDIKCHLTLSNQSRKDVQILVHPKNYQDITKITTIMSIQQLQLYNQKDLITTHYNDYQLGFQLRIYPF